MARREATPREATLAGVGEFGLIDRIEGLAAAPNPDVALGIGDDAALLRVRPGEEVAVSTDALVEGVHFRFDQESPRTAGRRAAAAALSDLAAMGARPLGVVCALAAPGRLPLRVALGLCRGLLDTTRDGGTTLVGGNVTRASQTSVTLTALGAVARGKALRRAGARPGDRILVTGAFGRAALERARGRVRFVPTPRLRAGRALARGGLARAAIDVSDGLLADLEHLCRASGVGAQIDAAAVPLARGVDRGARAIGREPLALALCGGEDYELLFAARPGAPGPSALGRRLGVPVAEIGRVIARGLRVEGLPRGVVASPGKPRAGGWRHF